MHYMILVSMMQIRRGELGVVGLNGAVNIELGQSQFELAAVSRVLELPLAENDKTGVYKHMHTQ